MANNNETTIRIIYELLNSMLFLVGAYYLFTGNYFIVMILTPIFVGHLFYLLIYDN